MYTQNFEVYIDIHTQFLKFKMFVSRSVFGEPQLTQILQNFQTCCNVKIRGLGAKMGVAFLCIILILKGIMTLRPSTFYVSFILSVISFIICIFSQYMIHWINFKNKYTFRLYKKTLLHAMN